MTPAAADTAPGHGRSIEEIDVAERTCSIEGCERPHYARTWCKMHWKRWWRTGDPLIVRPSLGPQSRPLADRFWEKVDQDAEAPCWIWTGGRVTSGYGQLRLTKQKTAHAHRVAYELLVGPIPVGLEIDHLCRNRICVNPSHLEPVPRRVNVLRGVGPTALNAAKTHCQSGHEFTPDNTIIRSAGKRERRCRTCRDRQAKMQYLRRKASRQVPIDPPPGN